MAEAELPTKRLETFFVDWAAMRRSGYKPDLAERLSRFLEKFRSLSALQVPAGIDPAATFERRLEINALENLLRALRLPLLRARSTGVFFNIWSTAGLRRDEVRNAAVLASLLDPRMCPETGPAFLWAFLQRARRSPTDPLPSEAELRAGYTVRAEDYPLGQAENRVDLSIEGRDFLLIIEVKIDAGEGPVQLQRYDEILRAKAALLGKRPSLLYLSPRPPESAPCGTVHARWTDVVSAAQEVGRAYKSGDASLFSVVLFHFAAHLAAFK